LADLQGANLKATDTTVEGSSERVKRTTRLF
jgi:hypothetical protein